MRTILTCMAVVALCGGLALADHDVTVPYSAPEGMATIDGDLSDWAGATWIALDEEYSPPVTDVTDAKYALRWSSATNMVYVAVSVTDTSQYFLADWASWNTQDDVELYIDAGNNNTDANNLGNYGTYQDYAQQMAMGYHSTGPWANFGWDLGDDLSVSPEYAAALNGNVITYEASFVPYSYYTGFGGTALPENIVTLAPNMTIGFDVVVGTIQSDGDPANFAMASNNLTGSKFKYSAAMQDWVLVPEPASMSLLALGGIALIRRRR